MNSQPQDSGPSVAASPPIQTLLAALRNRRSRRFGAGMNIPDGPLAYRSRFGELQLKKRVILVGATAQPGTAITCLLYPAAQSGSVVGLRAESGGVTNEDNDVQDELFNLFNQLNFNPAYAGSKEVLDAGLIYRNQWWSGIDGSPKNINLYGHMPFAKNTSGIGLNILTDKIGLDKVLTVGADYAYRIHFKNNNVLALGLGARIENARSVVHGVNASPV